MAIEFAIIFPLFLLIFYAIVSYSLLFVYQQGIHGLGSDAVRQAVSVARKEDGSLNEPAISAVINDFINADDAPWPGGSATLCDSEGLSVEETPDAVSICIQATLDLPQIDFSWLLPGGDEASESGAPEGEERGFKIPGATTVTSTSSIRL